MKQISVLVKPASSLCNMRCRYCFYEDESACRSVASYGRMTRETAQAVIRRVIGWADEVTFGFQGGEPTLAGLPFFEWFADRAEQTAAAQHRPVAVHYTLQTNGLLLDEAWCAFLSRRRFLVGLSLDGDAETHDRCRPDARGQGTFSRVWRARELLDAFGVDYNLVWVLTEETARSPERVWDFLVRADVRYVQFIPCLGPLDDTPSPDQLSPERFCSFYTTLYRLWDRELRAGRYRSVKFFDDLLNLLLYRRVTACGFTGRCAMQFVVEADGSVYPCDFYVLDRWRCGSFRENTVEELQEAARGFLCRDRQLPDRCLSCRWKGFCGGGCVRQRSSMYVSPDGSFCGYGAFLERNEQAILRTAALLQRING